MENKIGYYSETARRKFGYCIYLDAFRKEVPVTAVADEGNPCPSFWPDTYCVGKVVKFVRSNWKGNLYEKMGGNHIF